MKFRKLGTGLAVASAAGVALSGVTICTLVLSRYAHTRRPPSSPVSVFFFCPCSMTAGYWFVGLRDMAQKSHTIRRNFPVLGNVRYLFEVG